MNEQERKAIAEKYYELEKKGRPNWIDNPAEVGMKKSGLFSPLPDQITFFLLIAIMQF
ncbi:MAG: hypothetical protein HY787_01180 [Deltaproteobacteria bacterium]|nr:hypothetical protein [Deltaproteobacteria bacterium]